MPDESIPVYDGDDRVDRRILHHDNGDGTFSPTAYIVGEAGGGGVTQVEGKDAADNTITANPVLMGVNYDSELKPLTADVNHAIRVSLYGKNTEAGDTAIRALTGYADGVDFEADALARIPVMGIPYLFNGSTFDRQRTPSICKSFSAKATTQALWAPAAGKAVRMMGGAVAASVAGLYTLTLGGITLPLYLEANKSYTLPPLGNGFMGVADAAVTVMTATGGNLTGFLFGTEE